MLQAVDGQGRTESRQGTRRLCPGQESHATARQRPANGLRRCAHHSQRPCRRASSLRTKNACRRKDRRTARAQPLHSLHGPAIRHDGGFDFAHIQCKGGKAMKSGITRALAMRFAFFFVRAIAGATVLLTFLAFPRAHFAEQNSSSSDLTVHEWGTFTSISGKDGKPINWLPFTGSTELPSFVEHLREPNFKGGLRGTIRMETPIIYFYSPRETTVSVNVSFAKGLITEWYPHSASAAAIDPRKDFSLLLMQSQGTISWNSVHIEPGGATDFPRDASKNHYYAARETSSAPIRVGTPSGDQHERFLFYRGVSALAPPISAGLSRDGAVLVQSLVQEEIPDVILFERRGNKVGYRILGPLHDQASLALSQLEGS